MKHTLLAIIVLLGCLKAAGLVVVDSLYRTPLPNASVFDRRGHPVGICFTDGRLPYVAPPDYPITIRYIGYKEKSVPYSDADTIFLEENVTLLPDLVVNSRQKRVLHILAYVREFSTLSTYTDTVSLFREKLVDYMIPLERKGKVYGWSTPRVIDSHSYYRFTDNMSLDSVSNRSNHHFSWADWVGIAPLTELPAALCQVDVASDTVRGKYSATEMWKRNGDRITVDVDVLSDTLSRKWVPNLSQFFHNHLDFERFRIRYNFANVVEDCVRPADVASYSFNIESNGRGIKMFKFNRRDEPFYVSTYGEVYVLEKQYIPLKEAKQWERLSFSDFNPGIIVPEEVPDLSPEILALMERVDNVDHDSTRLALAVDKRLAGKKEKKFNVGNEIMTRLKGMFGIDYLIGRHKLRREWKDFRNKRRNHNQARALPEDTDE